jgi:hypothetical protein
MEGFRDLSSRHHPNPIIMKSYESKFRQFIRVKSRRLFLTRHHENTANLVCKTDTIS